MCFSPKNWEQKETEESWLVAANSKTSEWVRGGRCANSCTKFSHGSLTQMPSAVRGGGGLTTTTSLFPIGKISQRLIIPHIIPSYFTKEKKKKLKIRSLTTVLKRSSD